MPVAPVWLVAGDWWGGGGRQQWRAVCQAPPVSTLLSLSSCPQVVSDYLTGFDDPALMMRAGDKPVTIYSYRMAFWRAAS